MHNIMHPPQSELILFRVGGHILSIGFIDIIEEMSQKVCMVVDTGSKDPY